jgi:hypothetical protein
VKASCPALVRTVLVLGLASPAAHAQITVNNTTINSTSLTIRQQPTLVVPAPAPQIRTARPLPPPLPKPPPPPSSFAYQPRELLRYMSPRCAQLYEMQLSGPQRGMRTVTQGSLREEFQSRCPEAVSEARAGLYQDQLRSYYAQSGQKAAARMAAEQDRLTREQCDEMLSNLVGRRKRVDTMSDGEKVDLARFEAIYSNRCKAS